MPDIKDQIGDLASSVGQSEPVIQIANGISKVGEAASGAYGQAKRWVGKKAQQLSAAVQPTPQPAAPADIVLPKETKGKRRVSKAPAGRSMSKGR